MDQIGSPTNVFGLAEVCWKILGFQDYSIIKNRSKMEFYIGMMMEKQTGMR